MLSRSTMARRFSGMTRTTLPVLPRSRPAITMTVSFLRMAARIAVLRLQDFRSKREDLHEFLGTQLTGHWPEDTRTDRLPLIVDQDGGVRIELDVRSVRAAHLFGGTHDHSLHHIT